MTAKSPPPYRLITTTAALSDMVTSLADTHELALDTEFMREKTYYPQLCLIQLASSTGCWLIDPLAKGMDLEPLRTLLTRRDLTLILHSATADMEVLWHQFGQLPQDVFDTQAAARLLGYGDQVAYAELAQRVLDLHLNKAARGTDWGERPLKDNQLIYAAADVQHLPLLAAKLKAELAKRGRLDWLAETAGDLLNPASYQSDLSNQWNKLVNHRWKLPRQQLLYGLLLWRDKMAERVNRPRRWVISDDVLQDLAEAAPTSQAELAARRSLPPTWRDGDKAVTLLTAITDIMASPPALPSMHRGAILTGAQAAFLEMAKLLLKLRAEEEKIGAGLLASTQDLQAFAESVGQNGARGGHEDQIPFLTGWRYDLFGRFAQQLANGNLSLAYQDGRIIYRMAA
jgi:ribonuclease D